MNKNKYILFIQRLKIFFFLHVARVDLLPRPNVAFEVIIIAEIVQSGVSCMLVRSVGIGSSKLKS